MAARLNPSAAEMLTVPCWPDLTNFRGIWLATVVTPMTPLRDSARQCVRDVLRHILAERLACPSATFLEVPGEALRIDTAGFTTIGLSVSHEPGLSLLAVRRDGPVGVDLLRLDSLPADSRERRQLAVDYLGLPLPDLALEPADFARAWARHEARIKCLGMPLGEWNPELDRRLGAVPCIDLALPSGFAGALAW